MQEEKSVQNFSVEYVNTLLGESKFVPELINSPEFSNWFFGDFVRDLNELIDLIEAFPGEDFKGHVHYKLSTNEAFLYRMVPNISALEKLIKTLPEYKDFLINKLLTDAVFFNRIVDSPFSVDKISKILPGCRKDYVLNNFITGPNFIGNPLADLDSARNLSALPFLDRMLASGYYLYQIFNDLCKAKQPEYTAYVLNKLLTNSDFFNRTITSRDLKACRHHFGHLGNINDLEKIIEIFPKYEDVLILDNKLMLAINSKNSGNVLKIQGEIKDKIDKGAIGHESLQLVFTFLTDALKSVAMDQGSFYENLVGLQDYLSRATLYGPLETCAQNLKQYGIFADNNCPTVNVVKRIHTREIAPQFSRSLGLASEVSLSRLEEQSIPENASTNRINNFGQ